MADWIPSVAAAAGSIAGGLFASSAARSESRKNRRMQRDFAKNGISWRVADAKKAGINPLAALGANTISASPVVTGESDYLNQIGQNIGRAAGASMDRKQRNLELKALENNVMSTSLDNDIKRAELASIKARLSVSNNPPLPSPENASIQPQEIIVSPEKKLSQEDVPLPGTAFIRNSDGSMSPVPGKHAAERMEDKVIPSMVWTASNYLDPIFTDSDNKPPKKYLPAGYDHWEWSSWKGAYVPRISDVPKTGFFENISNYYGLRKNKKKRKYKNSSYIRN